jgi:hypothetical protein
MVNYEHKLRAIRVVKEWFDQAHEPIVMSTGHLDLLLSCIEKALQEGAVGGTNGPPATTNPLDYV